MPRRYLPALLALVIATSAGCSPREGGGSAGDVSEPETGAPGVEVTVPPAGETTTSVDATETAGGTVLDVTVARDDLQTFVRAARETGMLEAVRGLGPYTILAPTDEAFDALGADRLNELLRPESRAELARLVTYHIVPGKWTPEQIAAEDRLPTLSGGYIGVQASGGTVRLDGRVPLGARVAESTAGVVYLVDAVLQPPAVP